MVFKLQSVKPYGSQVYNNFPVKKPWQLTNLLPIFNKISTKAVLAVKNQGFSWQGQNCVEAHGQCTVGRRFSLAVRHLK